ncbi:hypothetical protein ACJX0J_018327 [Zea mays]
MQPVVDFIKINAMFVLDIFHGEGFSLTVHEINEFMYKKGILFESVRAKDQSDIIVQSDALFIHVTRYLRLFPPVLKRKKDLSYLHLLNKKQSTSEKTKFIISRSSQTWIHEFGYKFVITFREDDEKCQYRSKYLDLILVDILRFRTGPRLMPRKLRSNNIFNDPILYRFSLN